MILPQDPVQASIVHALNNHCYEDAVFLSERLFAEAPSDATVYLLAHCYYLSGKKSLACRFLRKQSSKSPKCKYLHSKCCFELGKLNEAAVILNGVESYKSVEQFKLEYGDSAAYAMSLLADIYRKSGRQDKAIEFYQASLSINPFMWSSFCKLCKLGAKPEPSSVFHSNHVQDALDSVKSVMFSPLTSAATQNRIHQVLNTTVGDADCNTSKTSTPVHCATLPVISVLNPQAEESGLQSFSLDSPDLVPSESSRYSDAQSVANHLFKTPVIPSFGGLPLMTPIAGTYSLDTPLGLGSDTTPACVMPPQQPPPIKNTMKQRPKPCVDTSKPVPERLVFALSSTSNTKSEVTAPATNRSHLQSMPRRRSKRILDNQLAISLKENSKVPQSRHKNISPKSSTRKTRSAQTSLKGSQEDLNSKNKILSSNAGDEKPATITTQLQILDNKQKQSAVAFLSLLQQLGTAYSLSQSYSLKEALKKYDALPDHHYRTGWVLAEVGKAHLELSEYTKAEEIFELLRTLEPYQVNGMETYSTVLFHLQKEVTLSKLAQDMVALDKTCPQTWCVNGNCFSLQKDHETAIKFLQRAVQVDEAFTYAYTLLGHEYTLTEDYDKAMSAFRNAVKADVRHYNAWYGLGMIYYKKEKFTAAETHFKKAWTINPQSAVLLCHIGLVQHALQRHELALETLNQAVELSPKNPMCLFHRASMLVANDKLQEALTELESLKVLTPKESLVYFLIGKVHKKLGNAHLSMLNFSWATDLDPKGSNNHIKEAIDRRYVTDDDENNAEDYESSSSLHSIVGDVSIDNSVMMDMDDIRRLQAHDLSDDSF